MPSHDELVPDLVPQLARGKHRSPRKGACFMELASFLAGERWSDHPRCTHPLLATLARLVNDHTSDAARGRLGPLVPSVIGLTGDDPRIDVRVMLRAATAGLPVVAAERQRILAVSVLTGEGVLAEMEGRPGRRMSAEARRALASAPDAERWARSFTREVRLSHKGFQRHAAPNAVRHAVVGIAQACVPDPDHSLYDLLAGAIADCEALTGRARRTGSVDREVWAAACRLSRTGQATVAP